MIDPGPFLGSLYTPKTSLEQVEEYSCFNKVDNHMQRNQSKYKTNVVLMFSLNYRLKFL